jgi:hypothetical protein
MKLLRELRCWEVYVFFGIIALAVIVRNLS